MAHVENENLDWGKCKIVLDKDTENEIVIEDVVDGSTSLQTTQGDKTEAKIEGGEVIATRYQRNKYALQFQEYGQPSIDSQDGVVSGIHSVTLINCDEAVEFEVFTIKAVINVQPNWTSQYGTVTQYTCDAVRQAGNTIVWAE